MNIYNIGDGFDMENVRSESIKNVDKINNVYQYLVFKIRSINRFYKVLFVLVVTFMVFSGINVYLIINFFNTLEKFVSCK